MGWGFLIILNSREILTRLEKSHSLNLIWLGIIFGIDLNGKSCILLLGELKNRGIYVKGNTARALRVFCRGHFLR